MNLQLVRYCYGPQHVAGLLKFGENLSLWTLECPWRDNQIFVSCVPDGSYPLVAFDSPEHPDTWVLTPVPGRTGILIHVGNKIEDTQGCILPGLTQDNGVVWNSLDAMRMLNYTLNRNDQHTITLGPGMGAQLPPPDAQLARLHNDADRNGNDRPAEPSEVQTEQPES